MTDDPRLELRGAPGQTANLADWQQPASALLSRPHERRPPRWRVFARRAYDDGRSVGYSAGMDASRRVLQEWQAADGQPFSRLYGNGHICTPDRLGS